MNFKLIDMKNFTKEGKDYFVLVIYGYNDIHNVYIDSTHFLSIKGDKTFDINKHLEFYYNNKIRAFKLRFKA